MEFFEFKKISPNDTLMQDIYRLRFKVYCEEWGFEKAEDHPDGLEIDEYDNYSVHFAAISKKFDQLIGTVRIILDSPQGFPIHHHCVVDPKLEEQVLVKVADSKSVRLGEISRLAVCKDYRRRSSDNLIYDPRRVDLRKVIEQKAASTLKRDKDMGERRLHDMAIVMGLYECLCRESRELQLTHWYVVTARALYVLLKRTGFHFDSIGPEQEYHGIRRPYLGYLNETLSGIPELYRLYAGD